MCCSFFTDQAVEKFLLKFDVLFYVGKKDKTGREKILCLESAKLFFSSGPQLVLQLWFLQVTKSSNIYSWAHLSQYLSVASSFLMATKAASSLLMYKRSEDDNVDLSLRSKAILFLKNIWKIITWTPLILTSILLKIGMIYLCIRVFGWNAGYLIAGQVILNLIQISLIHYCKVHQKVHHQHPDKSVPHGSETTKETTLFIGYANIFVITRPFTSLSTTSLIRALLVQPVQVLVYMVLLALFIKWENNSFTNVSDHNYFLDATSVLILGIVNILLCFVHLCKIHNDLPVLTEINDNDEIELGKVSSTDSIEIKEENVPYQEGDKAATIQESQTTPLLERIPSVEEDKAATIQESTPSLERIPSVDGSCAISEEDINFVVLHSKISLEDIQQNLRQIQSNQGMVDKAMFRKMVLLCYPDIGMLIDGLRHF